MSDILPSSSKPDPRSAMEIAWDVLFRDDESQKGIVTAIWQELDGKRVATNYEETQPGGIGIGRVAKSHELNAEELLAIQQTNSQGFRVIDIDPNLLPFNSEYNCIYSADILTRLFGPDTTGWGTNVQIDAPTAKTTGTPNPYWRTFALEIPGNYLRFEFLPVRTKTYQGFANENQNPTSVTPQNTNLIVNTDQYSGIAGEASMRGVLLDFETPSPSPIILTHGTELETTFNSFYLTFKQLNVRIRIIVGFNSKIHRESQNENNLSLFGGQGFKNPSVMNPIPFSLSQRDYGDVTGLTISPSVATIQALVLNLQNNPNIGIGIFYITGFRAMVHPDGFDEAGAQYKCWTVELLKGKYTGFGALSYTIQRLLATTVCYRTGMFHPPLNIAPAEPIRCSLRVNEALFLRVTPTDGQTSDPSFALEFFVDGYSFGNWLSFTGDPAPIGPFSINRFFTEHPFPCDLDTAQMPRR